MSQQRRASYPRTFNGLIGAMVVLVLIVVGWWGVNQLLDTAPEQPVQSVDWNNWVQAAVADDSLQVWAPQELPLGWQATSAIYHTGSSPQLRIGMLTPEGKFVGLVQSRLTIKELTETYLNGDATAAEDINLAQTQWQEWTSQGGDYALLRSVDNDKTTEHLFVYGSAPPEQVREFAASLVHQTE